MKLAGFKYRVTKARNDAIETAGTMIMPEYFEELTDTQIRAYSEMSELLIEHSEEVVRLLLKLKK